MFTEWSVSLPSSSGHPFQKEWEMKFSKEWIGQPRIKDKNEAPLKTKIKKII